MGIMPAPIDPGVNCLRCFAPNETPKTLKIFFGDIKTGDLFLPGLPPPPNGYWDISQVALIPCHYEFFDADKIYEYEMQATKTVLGFTWTASAPAFGALPLTLCTRYFTNWINNPVGNVYWGGFGFVCTPEEMQEWIELVTPITGPDPRMELFPAVDDKIVLKFCDKQSATNIKILVDSTLL